MVNPQHLISSRIQLHYAIQFMAAIANVLASPQPDGSHVTLSWDAKWQHFSGAPISDLFQVAFDPMSLNAFFLDPQGSQIAILPLEGQTLNGGLEWHKAQITQLGLDASEIVLLDYPPNDFPDHELARGGEFQFDALETRIGLLNYFQISQMLLENIILESEGADELHIWPHHFDMATSLSLPARLEGEPRSIGVGFSPGDAGYPEPYWYISPWPYPSLSDLPELSGGRWHTKGWVGAVLTASDLGEVTTEASQQSVKAFIKDAIAASYQLLNR